MHESEFGLSADAIRELGYQIVDQIAEEFSSPSRRPAFPPTQSEAAMEAAFGGPVPRGGMAPKALLDTLLQQLLPAAGNPNHPAMMANVLTASLPLPALIEALTATIKLRPTTWKNQPASCHIETTVVRWLGQMVGFSDNAAGYVTTGGSWANLVGMTLARVRKAGWDIRREGVAGHPPLVAYVSEEGHSCIDRSADLMGLGSKYLRKIGVDDSYSICIDSLEHAIRDDLQQGLKPFCLIGNAGTINTGAIDPLNELAELAQRYDLWFHVDGAYGAFAALDAQIRPLLAGIERADSLTVDPHKWLNTPFEAGCILTTEWGALGDAFSLIPPYLRGIMGDAHSQYEYGFELSRTDRALKVWLALKQYGVDQYATMVAKHHSLARYLAGLVDDAENFELVSPPLLSTCCFRYVPADLPAQFPAREAYLDRLNLAIEAALTEDGRALVLATELKGRSVLRVCIVSHAVTRTSVDETLALLHHFGHTLDAHMRADDPSMT